MVSLPVLLNRLDNIGMRNVVLEWFRDYLLYNLHFTTLARIRQLIYIFKKLRTKCEEKPLIQIYRILCECLVRYGICAWGGDGKT